MKFILVILSLTLFVSCSETEKKTTQTANSETSELEQHGYGMPNLGYYKAVNLNYNLNFMYERLTVNPTGNYRVLGDMPYFVEIDDKGVVEVQFYSDTFLKSVKSVHFGNYFNTNKIKEMGLSDLPNLAVREIQDFSRELSYGKLNPAHPEQDMLNKAFVIETQESDYPFVSTMTQLVWVECMGKFVSKTKADYLCDGGNLKFHYKLLDYQVAVEK